MHTRRTEMSYTIGRLREAREKNTSEITIQSLSFTNETHFAFRIFGQKNCWFRRRLNDALEHLSIEWQEAGCSKAGPHLVHPMGSRIRQAARHMYERATTSLTGPVCEHPGKWPIRIATIRNTKGPK